VSNEDMRHRNGTRGGGGTRILSVMLAAGLAQPPAASADARNDDAARAVHAVNRLSFGARPGDVERVQKLGVDKWIEQQLHPERIDDTAADHAIARFATLKLDTAELMKKYDVSAAAKHEFQQQQAQRMESGGADPELEKRRQRQELFQKSNLEGTPRQVLGELQEAKLLRAALSERQLDEVMTDFWFNHFNVFADKGPEKLLLPDYERSVIRKHALGNFEDLLVATARSPAMLFYLDNWLSADPKAAERFKERREDYQRRRGAFERRGGRGRMPQPPRMEDDPAKQPGGRRTGLNENYAREIMELHTLGVAGGYSQKDVTEVARCFTGWTIEGLRQQRPEFHFAAFLHDPGDKVVLGKKIKSGGEDEGLKVIHMLATHPATARFISTKLARRFVSDEPPAPLVERMAKTFEKTDGDIRAVLKTLFQAPEFWSASRAKVKTPFEFVVSALRASDASLVDGRDLARRLAEMGMPLYLQQPPTGYKDTAEAWVGASGLLARLNFALDLAAGRVRGVRVEIASMAPRAGDGSELTTALAQRFVPSGLGAATLQTLQEKAGEGLDAPRVAGLILGSPEFQRR